MKKKRHSFILVFVIVLLILSFTDNVIAEKLPCTYDFGKVTYDYDNKKFISEGKNKNDIIYVSDGLKDYIFKDGTPHKCYTFYGWHYQDSQGVLSSLMPTYYQMYADYYDAIKNGITNAKDICKSYDPIVDNNYESNQVCLSYDPLRIDIETALTNYKGCSNASCKNKYKSEINELEDRLKDSCKTILNFRPYSDECVSLCLKLSKTLSDYNDVLNNSKLNECGLSNNLIIWILNIVKWVKYIIPVIVILMGILDFIRAVASDKDDGMKKAQGRFVKRLIAAALIFIVQFILEFILEKFGITVKGCGIFDF